jgi:DNA-binding NarL/FixJ family response regulator
MNAMSSSLIQRTPKYEEARAWVWLRCDYPVVARGLANVLGNVAEVRSELLEQLDLPACVVICSSGESIAQEVTKALQAAPTIPVLVVGLLNDVQCARAALRAGATGFIHVGMEASQVRRALTVARRGETVVPRDLVAELVREEEVIDPFILTSRQREILNLVAEGLTNAQIAKQLFLSEYTIKQHLRAAYKLLEVRNRVEASRVFKRSQNLHGGGP